MTTSGFISNAPPLPTPRQLLTSIFNTLTNTPTSAPPPLTTHNLHTSSTSASASARDHTASSPNPFTNLPPSARALLTTLHVLFPPPTLLQALDLLDRGLVTKLVDIPVPGREDFTSQLGEGSASRENTTNHTGNEESTIYPPQAPHHLPPLSPIFKATHSPLLPASLQPIRNALYLVQSSQTSRGRGKYSGGGDRLGTVYSVRLNAWNCSCAAFVFAAFPGGGGAGDSHAWGWNGEVEHDGRDEEWEWESEEISGFRGNRVRREMEGVEQERQWTEWEFGGSNLDGHGIRPTNVPICKHLLACLLAERWDGVLGGYLRVKEVGREEMAGFGVEG